MSVSKLNSLGVAAAGHGFALRDILKSCFWAAAAESLCLVLWPRDPPRPPRFGLQLCSLSRWWPSPWGLRAPACEVVPGSPAVETVGTAQCVLRSDRGSLGSLRTCRACEGSPGWFQGE